jgi:hypothetical protein
VSIELASIGLVAQVRQDRIFAELVGVVVLVGGQEFQNRRDGDRPVQLEGAVALQRRFGQRRDRAAQQLLGATQLVEQERVGVLR